MPKCIEKDDYKIGDIIFVNKTVDFYSDEKIREFSLTDEHRYAYYVGYTFKQTGIIKSTNIAGWDEQPAYISYLKIENTYPVARIRFHSRGKEYFAFFEDIRIEKSYTLNKLEKN